MVSAGGIAQAALRTERLWSMATRSVGFASRRIHHQLRPATVALAPRHRLSADEPALGASDQWQRVDQLGARRRDALFHRGGPLLFRAGHELFATAHRHRWRT